MRPTMGLANVSVTVNSVHIQRREVIPIGTTVKPHLLHIVGRPISYAISEVMQ